MTRLRAASLLAAGLKKAMERLKELAASPKP